MSTAHQSETLQRHFVTVRGRFGARQVHYRRGGRGPVVLLLHQSPQSSRDMEPLFATWGHAFTLIAPDSPGYGFSEPMQRDGQPVRTASIDDFARATLEFTDALGIGRFGIYGFHTGASIGVALAHAFPERVAAVVANGLVVLTGSERTEILRDYLPPLQPRWDGGHLAWLWGRLRDQTIFFPWHDRRAATRMNFDIPTPERLQQGLQEFLAAGDHYHVAYSAAFTDRAEHRLPDLNVPLLITAAARDPLAAHLARIGARSAHVQIEPATDAGDALNRAFAHLTRHPGDAGSFGNPPESDDGASEYWGPPGRQIRLVRTAARDKAGRLGTLILLHAPGSSAAASQSLATTLAAQVNVLAVDLPGHGASDPAPLGADVGEALAGNVKQLVAALAALTNSAGMDDLTVLAVGGSAPVAIELAAQIGCRPGTQMRVVLLEPPTRSAADTKAWLRDGLPDLAPVWFGGHLLEAWHLVRDGRLFSPWFRRERAGIRPGEPDLDDARIHREVRDLLRANGAWQPLLRDALGYASGDGKVTRGSPGLRIIELDKPPKNWAAVLAPDHAGNLPRS